MTITKPAGTPDHSELGKKTEYDPQYDPDKLFPISRKSKRDEINVPETLPFLALIYGTTMKFLGSMTKANLS